MIHSLLDKIIDQYVERFFELNNLDHREFMKWEAAYEFLHFDFESSEEFVTRLKHLNKTCSVIIDKSSVHPFAMLCSCASMGQEYAERVREMFCRLFEEDNGDLQKRQSKIDAFIKECDDIRSECGKTGYAYANDQTAVMAYLALRDPENNYLLSTSKARELALRVGFGDDWGTLSNFKLDVYNRFCDELVEGLRNHSGLMEINKKRYEADFVDGKHFPLYEEKNFHLLAFDIIYCAASNTYNLGKVVPIDPIISEKYANAKVAHERYEIACKQMESLEEARGWLKKIAVVGTPIKHRKNGSGKIAEVIINEKNEIYLKLEFDKTGLNSSKFAFDMMLTSNILSMDIDGTKEEIDAYKVVLKNKSRIETEYRSAERNMDQYWEFIN